jgi:uncharacterized membrane protein YozB (DUF420 family)
MEARMNDEFHRALMLMAGSVAFVVLVLYLAARI